MQLPGNNGVACVGSMGRPHMSSEATCALVVLLPVVWPVATDGRPARGTLQRHLPTFPKPIIDTLLVPRTMATVPEGAAVTRVVASVWMAVCPRSPRWLVVLPRPQEP